MKCQDEKPANPVPTNPERGKWAPGPQEHRTPSKTK